MACSATQIALEGYPLDKLTVEVGKGGEQKMVPGLSPGWVEPFLFIHYVSPPPVNDDEEQLLLEQALWSERMGYFHDDVKYLLKLPHHRFWSQMVYWRGALSALDSFLIHAPRVYDLPVIVMTEPMKELQRLAECLVFLVFVRLATCKESSSCHITPTVFAELIYNDFLFDIPKIMDICALYGPSNKTIVQKMVRNIFNLQPKYNTDLTEAVTELMNIFDDIERQFGVLLSVGDVQLLVPELRTTDLQTEKITQSAWLQNFAYFVDTCTAVHRFLDVYPEGCKYFYKKRFLNCIASIYSDVVPFFVRVFLIVEEEEKPSCCPLKELKGRLSYARQGLLKTFRLIITMCCLQPLFESSATMQSRQPLLDDYFKIMTVVLSNKIFAIDYENQYPFQSDVELFLQSEFQLDYCSVASIRRKLNAIRKEFGIKSDVSPSKIEQNPSSEGASAHAC